MNGVKIFLLSCLLFLSSAVGAKKLKVACVGNSVTYGYGLTDRAHTAYPVKLQEMLGERYEVRNFGHSGATLLTHGHNPYVRTKEFREAMDFAADRVVIHLGLNDTDPRNWPNYRDEFEHDYYALIDSFRAANPKAQIWICLLTPIGDRHPRFQSGTRDWQAEIQQAIRRIAPAARVGLIDLHTPLYCRPDLFPDALHPDAEGAQILARTVYGYLTGDFGGLHMPLLFSDNMVLQRRRPIQIHGTANAGEKIAVAFRQEGKEKSGEKSRTESAATTAGADGKWSVTLLPHEAGGPYSLDIKAKSGEKHYGNILIGEVWLCSGQSNMEFTVSSSATGREEMERAAQTPNPGLRLFDMKARWATYETEWPAAVFDSLNRLEYYSTKGWTTCNAQTVGNFSAVAYYFGKALADSLRVPVGLICNAVGGSPTEAWISRHTLEFKFPAILRDWKNNDHIQAWVRGRAALNIRQAGNRLQRHPYEPCYLYEAGIRPLEQMPLKGVIWYQGESNAHNPELHERLFHLLVDDWRETWAQNDLPFYFVQLSSIGTRPSWTWFRDGQRRAAASIDHCEMAVSSDLGDSLNVHPKRKQEVGRRLALQALHGLYGFERIVPSGPLPVKLERNGSRLTVRLQWGNGLHTSDGKTPRTFEICGSNGIFLPATVRLEDGSITAWNDRITVPVALRYGWQPYSQGNLVNEAELPASTFRLDLP